MAKKLKGPLRRKIARGRPVRMAWKKIRRSIEGLTDPMGYYTDTPKPDKPKPKAAAKPKAKAKVAAKRSSSTKKKR